MIKRGSGDAQPVYAKPFTPMLNQAHVSYPVGATAVKVYIPLNAAGVLVQALTQNVRYTLNGSTPTAAVGFQLKASDPPLYIPLTEHTFFTVIAETAGAYLEYEFEE